MPLAQQRPTIVHTTKARTIIDAQLKHTTALFKNPRSFVFKLCVGVGGVRGGVGDTVGGWVGVGRGLS